MQIWFFFDAGTGGDGIANLFERSSNVTSIDGLINYWRVHRIVDKKIKFYAANPDVNGCFRSVEHFDNKKNQLDPGYVSCVTTNKNCIITSHDVTLTALYNSDCQDIFCKDQIKVLLTLTDQNKSKINAAIKNLCAELNGSVTFNTVDHSMFDIVLDVDKIQTGTISEISSGDYGSVYYTLTKPDGTKISGDGSSNLVKGSYECYKRGTILFLQETTPPAGGKKRRYTRKQRKTRKSNRRVKSYKRRK